MISSSIRLLQKKLSEMISKSIALMVSTVIILTISSFIYIIFYQLVIPEESLYAPLNFVFTNECGNHERCDYPHAHVDLIKEHHLLLKKGEKYEFVVDLDIPDTPINHDVGMFVIGLTLIKDKQKLTAYEDDDDIGYHRRHEHNVKNILFTRRYQTFIGMFVIGLTFIKDKKFNAYEDDYDMGNHFHRHHEDKVENILLTRRKSTMLKHKSGLTRTFTSFLFYPLIYFDYMQESQTISAMVMPEYQHQMGVYLKEIMVEIESKKLNIYSGTLMVKVKLDGFRHFMCHYPIVSFFIGTPFIVFPIVVLLISFNFYMSAMTLEKKKITTSLPSTNDKKGVEEIKLEEQEIDVEKLDENDETFVERSDINNQKSYKKGSVLLELLKANSPDIEDNIEGACIQGKCAEESEKSLKFSKDNQEKGSFKENSSAELDSSVEEISSESSSIENCSENCCKNGICAENCCTNVNCNCTDCCKNLDSTENSCENRGYHILERNSGICSFKKKNCCKIGNGCANGFKNENLDEIDCDDNACELRKRNLESSYVKVDYE